MCDSWRGFKTILCIIAVTLLCLVACKQEPRHEETYRYVRSIIDSVPEQALLILDSIPMSELQSDLDSARYILLHATAENKLQGIETSDTILQRAIDIFREHNEVEHLRYACYLCGSAAYSHKEYAKCLPNLLEAEDLIDEKTPGYEKGLIYHALSDYCIKFNGLTALNYIRKAYECYIESHKQVHAYYAKLSEAQILLNLTEYQEAKNILMPLIDSAVNIKDNELLRYSYEALGRSESGLDHPALAIKYLRKAEKMLGSLDEKTYAILLYSMKECGDTIHADSLARILLAQNNPWVVYALDLKRTSTEMMAEAYALQDESTYMEQQISYSNDYAVLISKNFQLKKAINKYKIKVRNLTIYTLTILLLLLIVVGIYIFKTIQRKHKEERENALTLYNDFMSFIKFHNLKVSSMQTTFSKQSSTLSTILYKYIEAVNQLVNSCLNNNKSLNNIDPKLVALARKSISNLRSDSKIKDDLEVLVNFTHNNLANKLKEEFPTLDSRSYLLFLLIAAEVSPLVISQILNLNSREYLNVLKHRLKKKIIENNPPSVSEFIKILS